MKRRLISQLIARQGRVGAVGDRITDLIIEAVEQHGGLDESGRYQTEAKREPGSLFDIDSVDALMKEIKEKLKVPYVNVKKSTLGGKSNVWISIAVSLDPEGDWENGIFENSRSAKFGIENNGTIEQTTGHYKLKKKFRKTHVKNSADLVKKLNKWVSQNA